MTEKPENPFEALEKARARYIAEHPENKNFVILEEARKNWLASLPPNDPGRKAFEALEKIHSNLFSTLTAKGWIRLCEILEEAIQDEQIKASRGALEFAEMMLELAGDALRADTADEALEPLLEIVDSDRASKKAAASHDGRRITREYAEGLFMQQPCAWNSLSTAAASMRDAVLAESKRHPRPLAPGNAQKTITEWLSVFVQRDQKAMDKLTAQGRKRISKARNTTR